MKPYRSVVKIKGTDDIKRLREKSKIAEINTCRELREATQKENLMDILKYQNAGFDPWQPERRIHLIEQVNLHATYDVALCAVEKLRIAHPNISCWELAPGNVGGGPDIFSEDQTIVAEVFAAMSGANNNKLGKDLSRLMKFKADLKYLFYKSLDGGEDICDLPSPMSIRIWRLQR